jgi:hypothetical protein
VLGSNVLWSSSAMIEQPQGSVVVRACGRVGARPAGPLILRRFAQTRNDTVAIIVSKLKRNSQRYSAVAARFHRRQEGLGWWGGANNRPLVAAERCRANYVEILNSPEYLYEQGNAGNNSHDRAVTTRTTADRPNPGSRT